MKEVREIAIINQHTSNFGDDAAGVCLVYQLLGHFPGANISIVYKKKNSGGDMLPISDPRVSHLTDLVMNEKDLLVALAYMILPRRIFNALFKTGNIPSYARVVGRMDAVFVSPCGANIGRYKDKLFLFRVMVAINECKKVIFCLNSVGRSGALWYDILAKRALKKTKNFVREKKSYADLSSWGVSPTLGVDTAFSMPMERITECKTQMDGVGFIAFVPTFSLSKWHPDFSGLSLDQEFLAIHSALARMAINGGYRIVIVPHLHGAEDESDHIEASREQLLKNGASVVVANDVKDPFSYANYLLKAKLVVSMRYHGIVLSARCGRPFVGISYENKMKEVASYCGEPDRVIDVKGITDGALYTLLQKANEDSDKIEKNLQKRQVALDRLARLPADWLYTF